MEMTHRKIGLSVAVAESSGDSDREKANKDTQRKRESRSHKSQVEATPRSSHPRLGMMKSSLYPIIVLLGIISADVAAAQDSDGSDGSVQIKDAENGKYCWQVDGEVRTG